MLKNFTFVAISLLGMAVTSTLTPSFASISSLERQITEVNKIQKTATKEVAPENTPKDKWLTCIGCNSNELRVLNALQERGITDRVALATVMANIKQESQFTPNVCEGGKRVSYRACRRGGFGLIQFTSLDRLYGLGKHATRIGGDPSSFDTQLDYIFTEPQWRKIEDKLKIPNQPVHFYMKLAYSWLSWGVKGPREKYTYEYLKRFEYREMVS